MPTVDDALDEILENQQLEAGRLLEIIRRNPSHDVRLGAACKLVLLVSALVVLDKNDLRYLAAIASEYGHK